MEISMDFSTRAHIATISVYKMISRLPPISTVPRFITRLPLKTLLSWFLLICLYNDELPPPIYLTCTQRFIIIRLPPYITYVTIVLWLELLGYLPTLRT
jgi:hypothetical protein